ARNADSSSLSTITSTHYSSSQEPCTNSSKENHMDIREVSWKAIGETRRQGRLLSSIVAPTNCTPIETSSDSEPKEKPENAIHEVVEVDEDHEEDHAEDPEEVPRDAEVEDDPKEDPQKEEEVKEHFRNQDDFYNYWQLAVSTSSSSEEEEPLTTHITSSMMIFRTGRMQTPPTALLGAALDLRQQHPSFVTAPQ
ncbi:hypothetical protein PIB30_106691, partial [Stylosanthes scabra]|nr:hypothetical protein [Stylosanthes scabra]